MTLFESTIGVGLGALVSGTAYLIHKITDTDKIVAAHIAEDAVLFAAHREATAQADKRSDERHADLKDRLQRIETKLDRAKIALEHEVSHD
jgi:hypothetical protein